MGIWGERTYVDKDWEDFFNQRIPHISDLRLLPESFDDYDEEYWDEW